MSEKPLQSTSTDAETSENLASSRTIAGNLAAIKLMKKLSAEKTQNVPGAEKAGAKKALDGALRALKDPKKSMDGALKALKRMQIPPENSPDKNSSANFADVGASVINEQASRKLAQGFKKLAKAQLGFSGLL